MWFKLFSLCSLFKKRKKIAGVVFSGGNFFFSLLFRCAVLLVKFLQLFALPLILYICVFCYKCRILIDETLIDSQKGWSSSFVIVDDICVPPIVNYFQLGSECVVALIFFPNCNDHIDGMCEILNSYSNARRLHG